MTKKILFMTNMPSPYRVEFFNELGKFCDLTVWFERTSDKGRDSRYKAGKFKNFTGVFLKGIRAGDAEAFCPEIIWLFLKKKFDYIIVGDYYSPTGMLAIEYMRLRKIPYILSSDGGMIKNDTTFRYKLKKHFIGSASGWLSTGKMTTKYLTYYGAKENEIKVYSFTSLRKEDILSHPLNLKTKKIIRERLGMTEEKIIISVGQFIYRKGYDILLKACAKFDSSIGVYIIGGKPTEEYVKIKEKLNLNNVHFVDFMKKESLEEYYKAADIFVLPTREDIWGLVVNEALSYGLPVVTTDRCVAGLELIKNGENGFIVPSEDENLLADACNTIIHFNAEKTSEKCLETIKTYTIEHMAQEHMDYINECDERV
ncbi:glycosyltransferase family 4 protein [Blautia sp. HCP28S3_G10]|uniref:glycosyltransferase family 4 protein n=1 Tax=Blautia sp. HCP28S3_G10 TaxID=3438908 RepID=UPI003F8ADFA9